MSAEGMTKTILATQLAAALEADQRAGGTYSPADDLWGPAVSAWITQTASELERLRRTAAAYKWGYGYLQDRMRSLGRDGWAEDCDGEIAARIERGG